MKALRIAGLLTVALGATVMTGVIIVLAPEVSLGVLAGLIVVRLALGLLRWGFVGSLAYEQWISLHRPASAS